VFSVFSAADIGEKVQVHGVKRKQLVKANVLNSDVLKISNIAKQCHE
jgi:hypothetical protein